MGKTPQSCGANVLNRTDIISLQHALGPLVNGLANSMGSVAARQTREPAPLDAFAFARQLVHCNNSRVVYASELSDVQKPFPYMYAFECPTTIKYMHCFAVGHVRIIIKSSMSNMEVDRDE